MSVRYLTDEAIVRGTHDALAPLHDAVKGRPADALTLGSALLGQALALFDTYGPTFGVTVEAAVAAVRERQQQRPRGAS